MENIPIKKERLDDLDGFATPIRPFHNNKKGNNMGMARFNFHVPESKSITQTHHRVSVKVEPEQDYNVKGSVGEVDSTVNDKEPLVVKVKIEPVKEANESDVQPSSSTTVTTEPQQRVPCENEINAPNVSNESIQQSDTNNKTKVIMPVIKEEPVPLPPSCDQLEEEEGEEGEIIDSDEEHELVNNIEHISDDFFADLLQNSDQICEALKTEPMDKQENEELENISSNNGLQQQTNQSVPEERIPDNFFDEFLGCEEDHETKYSEHLKEELKRLSNNEQTKKHKKYKRNKKSRKRSLSSDDYSSGNDSGVSKKRTCYVNSEAQRTNRFHAASININEKDLAVASGSSARSIFSQFLVKKETEDDSYRSKQAQSMSVTPIKLDKMRDASRRQEEPEEDLNLLTPKEKRERAVQRVKAALEYIKQSATKNPHEQGFLFTSTIRKLPTSMSYVNQKFYENRSPLHQINNVCYKFNSPATRFNLHEWGLEALSPTITILARLFCYDVYALHNKLKTIKLPAKMQNMRNVAQKNQQLENERLKNSSTYFSSSSTQTEEKDFNLLGVMSGGKGEGGGRAGVKVETSEVAVQVRPPTGHVAVQTSSEQSTDLEDLPIMSLMRSLNDNQLMSLHDFAELIKEPTTSNSMDMYRLRQRMLDIYKNSQIPSAMDTISKSNQTIINSAYGADGDNHRHAASISSRSASNDYHRNSLHTVISSTSSSFRNYNHSKHGVRNRDSSRSPPPPPRSATSAKFYGRGGTRH